MLKRKTVLYVTLSVFLLLESSFAYAAGLTIGSGASVNINDASLKVPNDIAINGTMTVGTGSINTGGSWANSGTFTAGTGTVTFIDGTSPASISGINTFYNLKAATTAGKQINFEAGKTQTVANSLTLQGASGNLLALRSTVNGQQAVINLQNGGAQSITYADVKDQSASSQYLAAGPPSNFNSVDSGNNTRWFDSAAPTITASPTGGTYTATQSVTLTCSDGAGAGCDKIYYTTNGTTPTTSSTVYSGPISIAANTTLKFFAKDLAGNSEAVKTDTYVIVVDTTAPTVSMNAVTTPTNSTSQTITGTVEAGATVNIATDSAASDGVATITGTTWSYTITGLVAGTNNITVTATDAAGNTATATSAITLDTTAPAFSSTSPSSDSFINTATTGYSLSKDVSSGKIIFTRTGGTTDSTSHVYNFTSSDITAGTHSVNTGLVLVNGAIYTVTFEATDSAGNTGSVSSTNATYDTSSASVAITSPAANSVTNNAKATYTLSEGISAGDMVFTRTGGTSDSMSPYTYTLSTSEMTAGNHTVDTGKALMDGTIYTVSFENIKDVAGNSTATVSNTNVKYDITAVAITNTTPAANSIITGSTVAYTLSEQAQSGKVTFTRAGGSSDNNSPHVYNLTASDLTSGSHTVNTNIILVDGAFYTVSFDATDLVGNASTTVSNAMVFYDSNYGIGPTGNVDNTSYSVKRVDGYDLIKLSIAFGSKPGDANWNPLCDLDGNSKVDGSDLIALGNHFGEVQ